MMTSRSSPYATPHSHGRSQSSGRQRDHVVRDGHGNRDEEVQSLAEEWRCDPSNAMAIVDRLERFGLAKRRSVAMVPACDVRPPGVAPLHRMQGISPRAAGHIPSQPNAFHRVSILARDLPLRVPSAGGPGSSAISVAAGSCIRNGRNHAQRDRKPYCQARRDDSAGPARDAAPVQWDRSECRRGDRARGFGQHAGCARPRADAAGQRARGDRVAAGRRAPAARALSRPVQR